MFRLNALTRQHNELPASLTAFSCIEDGHFDVPPISRLLQYRIIVSTCISSSLLFATGAPRGSFDYIFVDEAGYALEPEALVPILTIADANTRVVLSGDPKQLGPITHSPCASSFNFGKSFLERLMELEVYSRTPENPLCVPQTHHNFIISQLCEVSRNSSRITEATLRFSTSQMENFTTVSSLPWSKTRQRIASSTGTSCGGQIFLLYSTLCKVRDQPGVPHSCSNHSHRARHARSTFTIIFQPSRDRLRGRVPQYAPWRPSAGCRSVSFDPDYIACRSMIV